MKTIFRRGLIAVAPLAFTVVILYWLLSSLEMAAGVPLKKFIGPYYFPGLGIIAALIIIFFLGIIVNTWMVRKVYEFSEHLFEKIPFVKSIYFAIRDVIMLFQASEKEMNKVAKIHFGDIEIIGLVMRDNLKDLPEYQGDELIPVYVPMSFQLGGATLLVPKSRVTFLDVHPKNAMRFIITGGIKGRPNGK